MSFFGIIMSSLQPAISTKSLSAKANASTSSINVSSTANKRGTLSYNWQRLGKLSRIDAYTSVETTFTSLEDSIGTTTTYCDITDSVTGVTTRSPESSVIWTEIDYQSIAISGTVTYTGSAKAYTLTGTPATPAPSGTPSTFINAGTYYPINITITPGSNYTLGTVSGSFIIGKATLTITSNNASMTYGSSLPVFTHTPTGFVNSETAAVISGTVSHTTTGTSSSNVGTYVITPSVSSLSATNYTFTPVNGTLTIGPATLTATGRTGSATYTGSPQTVTVISGVNGTFSGSRDVTATVVGAHTTTINGTVNYIGSSVTGTLTIGKATLTITSNNASMTYGSSVPVFTHTPTGFVNSETAAVISGTVSHTTTGTSSSNVGTYVITPSVSSLSATNYTFTPVNGTLTIGPATLTATGRTGSATYTGSPQTVTVISGVNGTFSGSRDVTATVVGDHTTTINGTLNYIGSSVTGTLTIGKATLTATTTTSPYTVYNRQQQSFTISGINGSRRDIDYINSTTVYGTNAGTYTTRIIGIGNYTGDVDGTLTIHQDIGWVEIFYGGVYDPSYTERIIVPVSSSTAAFSVTHRLVYGSEADVEHYSWGYGGPYNWNGVKTHGAPGASVKILNPRTAGFQVEITASITDSNYTFMSTTTTVTVNAYSAPSGGGGFIAE